MDNFTEKHFEAWLSHAVRDDIREAVRALMLNQYESDPEHWNDVGWPRLYDEAVSPEVLTRLVSEARDARHHAIPNNAWFFA